MRLTLTQAITGSVVALAFALGVLLWKTVEGTGETLASSSDQLREAISTRIGERVTQFLARGPAVAKQIQLVFNRGLIDPRDPGALESVLLAPLLADENLTEVTLTYAEGAGFAPDGSFLFGPGPRGQLSALRLVGSDDAEEFRCRHVRATGPGTVVQEWEIRRGARVEVRQEGEKRSEFSDPTQHPTFLTPAREDLYGQLIWSDLHWSQLDDGLAAARRRVEVSVQQVMTDAEGKFAGVLRVGLLADQLNRAVQLNAPGDPHAVVLCDAMGRLITRGESSDPLEEDDDDLRVPFRVLPDFLRTALKCTAPAAAARSAKPASERLEWGGVTYLATFQRLPSGDTQDWLVGVVVPLAFYLQPLAAPRARLLATAAGVMTALVIGGALVARSLQRGHAQVVQEAQRMNGLRFEAAPVQSPFSDVAGVLESLERAKTALRAMSRYVPVDLVRRLYRMGQEPAPGGALTEVSLMFTDIAGFTTITETLAPARLAEALQLYLDALASVIQHETAGTIDKYIGDAIMTFWNAPEPLPDHALRACRAALRCRAAEETLMTSAGWRGLPPFHTRFGLHCGPAVVGHFGGSERLNYTAVGDAVNLASRLEGMNKVYGTAVIASEAIVRAVGPAFVFRQLDLVAAKGKQQAVRIYELLGPAGTARSEAIARYEQALDCYRARRFTEAIRLLDGNADDPPSAVLLARCERYQSEPPPEAWDGTYVAVEK